MNIFRKLSKEEIQKLSDQDLARRDGCATIRHYVIGGKIPQEGIDQAGGEVEYRLEVLEAIQGWSNLNLDEIKRCIEGSPDTIENSNIPNSKPLYLQALSRMRSK